MEKLKTKLCTEGAIETSLEEKETTELQGYNPLKNNEIPSEKVFVQSN